VVISKTIEKDKKPITFFSQGKEEFEEFKPEYVYEKDEYSYIQIDYFYQSLVHDRKTTFPICFIIIDATCIIPPIEGGPYGLFLSGLPKEIFHKTLLKNNFYGVLSLLEIPIKYPNDFEHKLIIIEDFGDENIAKHFEPCIEFIDQCRSKGNVLVHCASGVSRSATIVIAYLMKKNKWKYQEALEYVRKRRNIIEPNEGFVKQLKSWEKTIF